VASAGSLGFSPKNDSHASGIASPSASGPAGCATPAPLPEPPILISEGQEQALGLQSWREIRRSRGVSRNGALKTRLRNVGAEFARVLGTTLSAWEFEVFEGTERYAFALPGRKVGVYEGMFAFTQTDGQLAALVGHLLGHVQARHGGRRVSERIVEEAEAEGAIADAETGLPTSPIEAAADLGAGGQFGLIIPFIAERELEADRLGLELMAQAGFDPREAIGFWQGLDDADDDDTIEFLLTHPSPENRIEALEDHMETALALYTAATATPPTGVAGG